MMPPGRRVREWALVGMILLAGCASLPPPREAGQPVSHALRDEIVARVQSREGQIRSLRGIAAVEVTWDQKIFRFREAVALRSDGRFRLETLGALGLPTLIIASDGSQVVAHNPRDPAGKSPDGCEYLNRLLGLELPPAAFVRLLAGLSPRPVVPSPFVSYLPERRVYLLEGEEGDLTVNVGEVEAELFEGTITAITEGAENSSPWTMALEGVEGSVTIYVSVLTGTPTVGATASVYGVLEDSTIDEAEGEVQAPEPEATETPIQ